MTMEPGAQCGGSISLARLALTLEEFDPQPDRKSAIVGVRLGTFVKLLSLDLKDNQLLAALPKAEMQRWLPLVESVDLPLGAVLYESGATLSHVYFPTTAIISLL